VRKLWSLGVQASLEEVVTVGAAVQFVLAEREPGRAYVIGSAAVFRHVADAGHRIVNGRSPSTEADIVVVAGHDDFNFAELRDATQALLAGAEMIACDRDRTFPREDGMWPGSGAIVAALEYATERTATVVGKPEPQIFRTALDRLDDGRTLVVGDRLDADLEGAAGAGLEAAIVLTGVSTREDAAAASDPAPVTVADDLRALVVVHGR
jgi:HAD superfamily hydrolase (TIGR01450 family)